MDEGIRTQTKKILIAGVPFGRDNVGDEAILECIVSIVTTVCPDAEIWVSTDDREATGKKLKVKTVPLFGFVPPGFSRDEMIAAIDAADVFIWAGATGLSDYPDIPLMLMQQAADRGKTTVIFCTGMNTELNPFLYRLLPGGRYRVFSLIHKLSFGSIDLVQQYESRKRRRTAEKMKRVVESADLVVLRDAQSFDAMCRFIDKPDNSVLIGADPAIELVPKSIELSRFSAEVKEVCRESNYKIGLCLSAQSPVRQLNELAVMFDRLIDRSGVKIVGIPMNPITDAQLMNEFRNRLQAPDAMCVADGRFEPDEIAGLASEMDVVISSRLHLLILASITLTPFIGISRGSKITNFTSQFQLPEIGSVDALDVKALEGEIVRLLNERSQFEKIARAVRTEMLERMAVAMMTLSKLLIDKA
jgi:polysaccharide pyruvyl transferase WcaK-like protein